MMLILKVLNDYGNSTATKATHKAQLLESVLLLQYIIENLIRICNNLITIITIVMQGGI